MCSFDVSICGNCAERWPSAKSSAATSADISFTAACRRVISSQPVTTTPVRVTWLASTGASLRGQTTHDGRSALHCISISGGMNKQQSSMTATEHGLSRDKLVSWCKVVETSAVFSLRRNTGGDSADVISSGRVVQSLGPTVAKDRSPTVKSRGGRTTSSQEVDGRFQFAALLTFCAVFAKMCAT